MGKTTSFFSRKADEDRMKSLVDFANKLDKDHSVLTKGAEEVIKTVNFLLSPPKSHAAAIESGAIDQAAVTHSLEGVTTVKQLFAGHVDACLRAIEDILFAKNHRTPYGTIDLPLSPSQVKKLESMERQLRVFVEHCTQQIGALGDLEIRLLNKRDELGKREDYRAKKVSFIGSR